MRTLFLILFSFLISIEAFARAGSVFVKKPIPLTYDSERGEYSALFIFLEDKPGKISDDILSHGCEVMVEYQKSSLPIGEYRIEREMRTSPGMWDRRWYRNIKLSLNGGRFSISCKTTGFFNPLSNFYINRVGKGYIVIK